MIFFSTGCKTLRFSNLFFVYEADEFTERSVGRTITSQKEASGVGAKHLFRCGVESNNMAILSEHHYAPYQFFRGGCFFDTVHLRAVDVRDSA